MRPCTVRRGATLVMLAGLLTMLVHGSALAHAELLAATPADKSTVIQAVTEISGTFTQGMDAASSKLDVKDANGATIAQGSVDPSDPKRMVATPSTPLGTGMYSVEWTTLSLDDGELARGTWTFTVAVASASASPAPATAVPSIAPTIPASPVASSPSPVPSAGGDMTRSGGEVLLPIIVALVILGAGAAYLLSRRTRPPASS